MRSLKKPISSVTVAWLLEVKTRRISYQAEWEQENVCLVFGKVWTEIDLRAVSYSEIK